MNQERLFSAILENVHDGIIALDKNLFISFVNPAAVKMSQWEKAPLNQRAAQLFILLEPKSLSNLIGKKLPQDEKPFLFKDAIYKCGSNTLIVDGSIARIPEEDGHETQGYVIVIRDISDMKKLSATLDYQISHDALTGLANREGFNMQLEDVLDSVKRVEKNAALLRLDIDNYDAIKTETGEAGGNALLTWFTHILQSQVKHRDLSARLRGCAFTLVLFDCTLDEAEGAAQRIHHAAAEGFIFEGRQFPVTVSAGLVEISEKATFAAALLSSADAACNAAKKAGGGQTVRG
jgi:diguanylate cyclase (GGDEF)-like protein/PAS domain S-box-containing protein